MTHLLIACAAIVGAQVAFFAGIAAGVTVTHWRERRHERAVVAEAERILAEVD